MKNQTAKEQEKLSNARSFYKTYRNVSRTMREMRALSVKLNQKITALEDSEKKTEVSQLAMELKKKAHESYKDLSELPLCASAAGLSNPEPRRW